MTDIRVHHIFTEQMKGDTSFQEKETGLSLLFGSHKYSKHEMRETWQRGIRHGIEIGLMSASLEGQRIELNNNTIKEKHKEYLEKAYKLAAEYGVAIQYHYKLGMVVVDRNYDDYGK